MFTRVAELTLRFRVAGLVASLLVALTGVWLGRDVPLALSISDLLPPERESVRDVRAVSAAVGGIGYLGVLIGPIDAPERFAPTVARALSERADIRYAFFEREEHSMRARALYLIPREELDELVRSAELLLRGGSTGGALDLGLDTAEERAANESSARAFFASLRAKYLDGAAGPEGRSSQYFLSGDGRHVMVFAKPSFDSESLGLAEALVDGARRDVARALGPDVPFRLWGRYVNQVTDTHQIQHDIKVSSLFGVLAILTALVLGLGGLRGALLSIGCVVVSMGWTAAFIRLAVGQVNIVTGFMLAILSGLGVEYGVHLVRRFQQELASGASREDALHTTQLRVGRALLSAALTSAGAFLILATSDFRGFSELGLIAGAGVLSIYAVYLLSFPVLSRLLPDRPALPGAVRVLGGYVVGRRFVWALPVLLVLVLIGASRAELEVDLQRMRKLSDEAQRMGALVVELMGGRSTTPAVLLASSAAEADRVRDLLADPRYKPTVQETMTLRSIVPPDQHERARVLARLARQVRRVSDAELGEKTGLDPSMLRDWASAQPYTAADLPPNLTDAFGSSGGVVVVYSDDKLDTIDGIQRFARMMVGLKAESPGLKVGTDAVILSEIIDYVFDDGRIVALLFAIGAFLVMWLDLRSIRGALLLELQLGAGILVLVGFMGLAGVPFTILNVAMIPAVLAAGIDMGVHLRHRQLEGGGRSSALECARAVAKSANLGAITTLLGFGALFLAQAEMLQGIAWISVLGQVAMYVVCMVAYPLLADVASRLRGPHPT